MKILELGGLCGIIDAVTDLIVEMSALFGPEIGYGLSLFTVLALLGALHFMKS